MNRLIIVLMTVLLLLSCKTKYITTETVKEVPVVEVRTEYRDKLIYDSIYKRDSIYLHTKGDTVYKYVEKHDTKFLYRKDTIHVVDSVPVITNTVKTVTKVQKVNEIYWWQKLLMFLGAVLSVLTIIYAILKIKKFI